MAIITYVTQCPCCGLEVEAEISVQPEQQEGPETEYLPERWEFSVNLQCDCGHDFQADEVALVLRAARRYYGT